MYTCAPWDPNCLMALSGCLVICCGPPASGWWEEALGGPEEGRTYTDHLPCTQVPAGPVMTPSSSWPCALATLVRESATPMGRRGKPGPPLPYMRATGQCLPAVIHGTIHRIAHDTELQESVITVAAVRVLRQTLPLFQAGGSGGPVQASIRTPLRCGVRSGHGTFLFMSWSHFGVAWLGCAPRFQEFSRAYAAAHTNHLCPFEVAPD